MPHVDDTTARIAKRITQAMISFGSNEAQAAEVNINTFKGLGLALAFCFEECTGISARHKKPGELMKWAVDLPLPLITRVRLD